MAAAGQSISKIHRQQQGKKRKRENSEQNAYINMNSIENGRDKYVRNSELG